MYSTAFWCLIVVYWFFWIYCITTVTPFTERSEGWSLQSVGVLDHSKQKCRFFFTEIQIRCKFFSSSRRRKSLLPLWEIGAKKNPQFPHQIEPFVPDFEARLAFVQCL